MADKAAAKRAERNERARAQVNDIRRFKDAPIATGESKPLAADHPALQEQRTLFPGTVRTPSPAGGVLIGGENNVKIGGYVLVGPLKGARILTLALEERATCPRSCKRWADCYGNSMPMAKRWAAGPELLSAIEADLEAAFKEHEKVLVRLHVLGDFYSLEYVEFWARMLKHHPGLYLFGFTAHAPVYDSARQTVGKWGYEIGHAVGTLNSLFACEDSGPRAWIRWSERTGDMGAFTIPFPTEEPTIGDAIVCPEQRDAIDRPEKQTHCGSCGLCWGRRRAIAFIRH